MSTVALPLALESTSQQLLCEDGETVFSVDVITSATGVSHLDASLTILADATDDLAAHLAIRANATQHLNASLTIPGGDVTQSLPAHLSIHLIETGRLAASLSIIAKYDARLAAYLAIFTAIEQQRLDATLTITAKGRPSLPASLTIFHPHANLGAKLTIKADGHKSVPAHLTIKFTGLMLMPVDATLPYNEVQVYQARYMHEDGSITIPTGTFTTSAGRMEPAGVTSGGEATLYPDPKLGEYYVGFVELE